MLLVEDTAYLARLYEKYLQPEGYELIHVETGKAALAALESAVPDAVLLDLVLPDMNGIEILRAIAERALPTVVVVITAHGSVNVAVEAMRLGAFDFLIKPFEAERLAVTLRNALERQRLRHIVETYRQDFDRSEYLGFVGRSLAMQSVYRIIESAARSKATVFITGESGTGKEICAQALHRASPRARGPFIAINCGAIPKELMESEIFGHAKGAFTGAVQDRDGAAKLADGGTLFLDELCEMEPALQVKLLRFVQTGTFQKVGDSRLRTVDVRIVCATNRDPLKEVAAQRLREDLYYRLHVIPVHLPPLREREDDVVLIARRFLADFAKEEGKRFVDFDPVAEAALRAYTWPGNVRQLQNLMRTVVVLNDGDTVAAGMLPEPLCALATAAPAKGTAAKGSVAAVAPTAVPSEDRDAADDASLAARIRPLTEVEHRAIEDAIRLCGGNIVKAAGFLGVSPSTLYRKRAQPTRPAG